MLVWRFCKVVVGLLQVVQGKPASLEQEAGEEEVSLLTGHMQEDVSATNQKPLLLGLLKVFSMHATQVIGPG